MKNIILLSLGLILFSANSCKEHNHSSKGSMTITFKALYENDPLLVFNDYLTPDGNKLQFHVFNFFLSDIELVKENDEVIRLKDIDFIDFNGNTDLARASAGIKINIDQAEIGSFKAIRFGVGVEPIKNAKEPGDFPADPFLGDPGNYWTSWNSYIFSRIEGRLDTLPNAAGGDVSYLYHSGVDGMYQTRTFSKTFEIKTGVNTELIFNVNGKDIFYKSGAEINIPNANFSHSGAVGTTGYDLARQTVINIADAISIQ
jgi:hypothetical protein